MASVISTALEWLAITACRSRCPASVALAGREREAAAAGGGSCVAAEIMRGMERPLCVVAGCAPDEYRRAERLGCAASAGVSGWLKPWACRTRPG